MNTMKHYVAALVLFGVLVTILAQTYTSFNTSYEYNQTGLDTFGFNATDTDSETTGNIMHQFEQLPLRQGIDEINGAFSTDDAGEESSNPGQADLLDLLGGLATAAIGILKTLFGLVTLPLDILRIVATYYGGAQIGFITQLAALVTVYIGFVIISSMVGREV